MSAPPLQPTMEELRPLWREDVLQRVLRRVMRTRGARPRGVRIERCWPTHRGSMRFEWSFVVPGGHRQRLYAAPASRGEKAHHTLRHSHGVFDSIPDFGLEAFSPDRDPHLSRLRDCLNAKRVIESAPVRSRRAQLTAELLGYKPGKRAAIAYLDSNSTSSPERFVGKILRKHGAEPLAQRLREVDAQLRAASHGRVRAPQVIEYLPDLELVLFEWVNGQRMGPRFRLTRDHMSRMIDSLVALHRIQIDGVPSFTVVDELTVLERWVSALRAVQPRAALGAEPLMQALEALGQTLEPRESCIIHRDFYEKQLVWQSDVTVLLDLDTLAWGDPAQDVGNLLAHLALHSLTRRDGLSGFDKQWRALTARYNRRTRPLDPRAVAFFCASSLIRSGCLHRLRTRTRRYGPAMWRVAAQLLERDGRRRAGPRYVAG